MQTILPEEGDELVPEMQGGPIHECVMAAFILSKSTGFPHGLRHRAKQLEHRKMGITLRILMRLVGAIGFEPMTSTV